MFMSERRDARVRLSSAYEKRVARFITAATDAEIN